MTANYSVSQTITVAAGRSQSVTFPSLTIPSGYTVVRYRLDWSWPNHSSISMSFRVLSGGPANPMMDIVFGKWYESDTLYEYLGWNNNGDQPKLHVMNNTNTPYSNFTITISFMTTDQPEYTISRIILPNENAGNIYSAVNGTRVQAALEGETVVLSYIETSPYEFRYFKSDDVEISANQFIMPAKNVTVYGVFRDSTKMNIIGYYDGTSWVPCTVNYYDGTKFVECDPYYYNGTTWVPISTT